MWIPMMCRLSGSVICRIWFQVLLITVYTAGIVCLNKYLDFWRDFVHLPPDSNITKILGIICGLLLVFRTNTAYDRYWEGRKLWSQMVFNIRTLVRTFWIFVNDQGDSKMLVEKISVINLLTAFAYAVKHYLREEYSYDEEDMRDFTDYLPRLYTPSSNEPLRDQEALSTVPLHLLQKRKDELRNARSAHFGSEMTSVKQKARSRYGSDPFISHEIASNIPIELTFYISSFIRTCKDHNLVDSPTCRILDTSVSNLVNCLSGLERIRRTPIPLSYTVHLYQIAWLVLLLLPLELTTDKGLDWVTIPCMTLLAFALFGILGLGREIENPFGYDDNDLNLDDFCQVLHKEIMALMTHTIPKDSSWMTSAINRPILTEPELTAVDLAKMKYEDIHEILLQGRDFKFMHRTISHRSTRSKSKADNLKIPDIKIETKTP